MEKKIFTIQDIRDEGGGIKLFTLSPDDGTNIRFKPGQFAMVCKIENGGFGKLSRPYSIASSPLHAALRFAIKITGGQFTSVLEKMKAGEKLGVTGPLGHFQYEKEENVVCLAAGTGVASMTGILEYVAHSRQKGKFTLFYSNKKKGAIACREILDHIHAENPHIKVVYTLTQEQPEGWKGELGRINAEMVRKHADGAKDATFFVCGPLEFAKAMKEMALGLGADPKKVKIEAWG